MTVVSGAIGAPTPPGGGGASARYASLAGFVETCREVGVDAFATMRAQGLDPAQLSVPDSWAPALDVARALESAAAVSGHGSVGVRMAQRRPLSALGPVSLALREEPTLREALDLLTRFWPSYNEALRVGLTERAGITSVTVAFALDPAQPQTQAVELAAGVVARLAAARPAGPVTPVAVRFPHPPPVDGTDVQREVLGVDPAYGADGAAVDFRTQDVDRPSGATDPQVREYARRYLDGLVSTDTSRAQHVRRLVEDLLPTGRCSLTRVAAGLGVDRRTIHRWLAADGTTFGAVLDDVRRARAEHHLTAGRLSHIEIAEALGFASPSSFSRWFSGAYGVSPRRWAQSARPG